MHSATLSSKFQICIPRSIRDSLHLKVGQELIFIQDGNCLHLVPKRKLIEVKGILAGANIQNFRDRRDRI